MSYSKIINKASKEVNLPKELVNKVYKAYWYFIRHHIERLPLKIVESKEDFDTLQTNFNVPSIGKLNCTYSRLQGLRKQQDVIKSHKNDKD